MRCTFTLGAAAILATLAGPAFGQTPAESENPSPLTEHELLEKYVWATLGPSGAVSASVTSAVEQWRESPEAWPRDGRGYAERWASEYAAAAIGSTTKYAVAQLLHQDPSFVRCTCTGVGARLRHAVTAPFKARTADGTWVFSPATVAGLGAENLVPAMTWYPAPRGARDGLVHAAAGVGSKIAVDLWREFAPRRLQPKTWHLLLDQ